MYIPQTLEECKSQGEAVLYHLANVGSLTQHEATPLYGIERLGARIYELRTLGFEIETIQETGKNRFGHVTPYARYVLRGTP